MRILITGAWPNAKANIPAIQKMGHTTVFLQNENDQIPNPQDFDAVICNNLFKYHDIKTFTSLRYIQTESAGLDQIPDQAKHDGKITINNANGVYSIPMADSVLANVLQLARHTRQFNDFQKAKTWQKDRTLMELDGKTVVIIGMGNVAKECAKRFKAFGCTTIALNRTIRPNPYFDTVRSLEEIDTTIPDADILVIAIPSVPETQKLLTKARLNKLKKTAILVNVARGNIIDQQALLKTLPTIQGAYLDVFESEPLPSDSPLWTMPNVIITPHNSYIGDGNNQRLDSLILKNLEEYAK